MSFRILNNLTAESWTELATSICRCKTNGLFKIRLTSTRTSGQLSSMYIVSLLLFSIILISSSAQPSDGAAFNAIGKHKSARDRGCFYMLQHFKNGEQIKTDEPCLNCTCEDSMLMCYLRVCPYVKPMGDKCIIERVPGECCPKITCPDVAPPSDSLEQELEPEAAATSAPTTTTSSTTSATTSTTTTTTTTTTVSVANLDRTLSNASETLNRADGCMLNGKYYHEGAQLPTDNGKPCEVCYCIRNTSACMMQDCALEVSGCSPVYQAGGCCPTRYNCSAVNAFTTPRPQNLVTPLSETTIRRKFWENLSRMSSEPPKTSSAAPDLANLFSTTMKPIAFPSFGRKDPSPSAGCRAPNSSRIYADGEKVPSKNKCEHCYCMRSEIVCAVQECRPPCDGCVPIIDSDDQCCPKKYECPAPLQRVPTDNVIYSPDITTPVTQMEPKSDNETVIVAQKVSGSEPSQPSDKALSQSPATTSSTLGPDSDQPKPPIVMPAESSSRLESSIMTTRQTKSPLRPISPKLSINDDYSSNEMVSDQDSDKKSKTSPTDVDGFNLQNEKDMQTTGRAVDSPSSPMAGSSLSSEPTTQQPQASSTTSITAVSEPVMSSTSSPVKFEEATSGPRMDSASQLGASDKKPRPQVMPSTIPGEGSCRYNGRIYHNGQEVKSKDACMEICMCINSVVYCDEVDCPKGPEDPDKCQRVVSEGECCPKYICPDEETTTTTQQLGASTSSTPESPLTSGTGDQSATVSSVTLQPTEPVSIGESASTQQPSSSTISADTKSTTLEAVVTTTTATVATFATEDGAPSSPTSKAPTTETAEVVLGEQNVSSMSSAQSESTTAKVFETTVVSSDLSTAPQNVANQVPGEMSTSPVSPVREPELVSSETESGQQSSTPSTITTSPTRTTAETSETLEQSSPVPAEKSPEAGVSTTEPSPVTTQSAMAGTSIAKSSLDTQAPNTILESIPTDSASSPAPTAPADAGEPSHKEPKPMLESTLLESEPSFIAPDASVGSAQPDQTSAAPREESVVEGKESSEPNMRAQDSEFPAKVTTLAQTETTQAPTESSTVTMASTSIAPIVTSEEPAKVSPEAPSSPVINEIAEPQTSAPKNELQSSMESISVAPTAAAMPSSVAPEVSNPTSEVSSNAAPPELTTIAVSNPIPTIKEMSSTLPEASSADSTDSTIVSNSEPPLPNRTSISAAPEISTDAPSSTTSVPEVSSTSPELDTLQPGRPEPPVGGSAKESISAQTVPVERTEAPASTAENVPARNEVTEGLKPKPEQESSTTTQLTPLFELDTSTPSEGIPAPPTTLAPVPSEEPSRSPESNPIVPSLDTSPEAAQNVSSVTQESTSIPAEKQSAPEVPKSNLPSNGTDSPPPSSEAPGAGSSTISESPIATEAPSMVSITASTLKEASQPELIPSLTASSTTASEPSGSQQATSASPSEPTNEQASKFENSPADRVETSVSQAAPTGDSLRNDITTAEGPKAEKESSASTQAVQPAETEAPKQSSAVQYEAPPAVNSKEYMESNSPIVSTTSSSEPNFEKVTPTASTASSSLTNEVLHGSTTEVSTLNPGLSSAASEEPNRMPSGASSNSNELVPAVPTNLVQDGRPESAEASSEPKDATSHLPMPEAKTTTQETSTSQTMQEQPASTIVASSQPTVETSSIASEMSTITMDKSTIAPELDSSIGSTSPPIPVTSLSVTESTSTFSEMNSSPPEEKSPPLKISSTFPELDSTHQSTSSIKDEISTKEPPNPDRTAMEQSETPQTPVITIVDNTIKNGLAANDQRKQDPGVIASGRESSPSMTETLTTPITPVSLADNVATMADSKAKAPDDSNSTSESTNPIPSSAPQSESGSTSSTMTSLARTEDTSSEVKPANSVFITEAPAITFEEPAKISPEASASPVINEIAQPQTSTTQSEPQSSTVANSVASEVSTPVSEDSSTVSPEPTSTTILQSSLVPALTLETSSLAPQDTSSQPIDTRIPVLDSSSLVPEVNPSGPQSRAPEAPADNFGLGTTTSLPEKTSSTQEPGIPTTVTSSVTSEASAQKPSTSNQETTATARDSPPSVTVAGEKPDTSSASVAEEIPKIEVISTHRPRPEKEEPDIVKPVSPLEPEASRPTTTRTQSDDALVFSSTESTTRSPDRSESATSAATPSSSSSISSRLEWTPSTIAPLLLSSSTASPADDFVARVSNTSSSFKPVDLTTIIPSIRGSAATITIPWSDISTTQKPLETQSTIGASPATNMSSHEIRPITHESANSTEVDYEEVSEDPGCEYEGKTYNSAQQIPRSHPCDFCFCFRGDIICLQQTCPPPVPHCFETVMDGFCCPRYECPVHTVRGVNNSTNLSLTPYESHSRHQPSPNSTEPGRSPITTRGTVKGCFVDNKLYGVGQVIDSASGPCLECKCDRSGMMNCNPKECTPEDPLLQQINREVLQSTLSRSQVR